MGFKEYMIIRSFSMYCLKFEYFSNVIFKEFEY